jgi:hypothetical protein
MSNGRLRLIWASSLAVCDRPTRLPAKRGSQVLAQRAWPEYRPNLVASAEARERVLRSQSPSTPSSIALEAI